MCLTVAQKYNKLIKVNTPILVWKVLEKTGFNNFLGCGPYMGTFYTNGVKRTSKLDLKHGRVVEQGLHSCRTLKRANYIAWNDFYDNRIIYPAIIPRGSHLYIGDNDDLASTQLVVFKDMDALREEYPGATLRPRKPEYFIG